MDRNCVEDICNVMRDILLVCEILNCNRYNKMLDDSINRIRSDVDEIESKYT